MLTSQETETELGRGAVVFPMPRDLVITSGEDAASFLNGQLSQAIEVMALGDSRWSLLLEPKGKVSAWLRVTRVAETMFWLDSEPGNGEAMLARLNRFILRTRVSFELVEAQCFAVRGSDLPDRPANTDSQMSVPIGYVGSTGFDIIGPGVVRPDGVEGNPAVLDALRVRDGAPAMGKEFQRATIPAETGVVELSADFAKGCYTGQELVARVNSRGNKTPRKIHRVTLASSSGELGDAVPTEQVRVLAEEGDRVLVDGSEVGTLTSVANFGGDTIALASIKRGVEPTEQAEVESDDVRIRAHIHPHEILKASD